METSTLLLILCALVLSVGISWFQYFYKSKSNLKVKKLLVVLRFLSIFGILLLLINPKITQSNFQIVKPNLVVAVDNSKSIKELGQDQASLTAINQIKAHSKLNDKFEVQLYQFDNNTHLNQEFDFTGNQTRIDRLAEATASIYRNKTFPTLLISDGNQTLGRDYIYTFPSENHVYPIVLGDTITHLDLKITQLNANKYAFHKNKFPVEVFLNYEGDKTVTSTFSIQQGESVIYTEKITFSKEYKSHTINALLDASKVGIQVFKAQIQSSEKEKNTYNNIKNFAVEIIDQKTEIAIISDINHPDLGVLKRSMERNDQNRVNIISTQKPITLSDYNVVILYQPTRAFEKVMSDIKSTSKSYFLITGKHTDFGFLNSKQEIFNFRGSGQKEDYLSGYDAGFSSFAQEDIGFSDFPPLENIYGSIEIKQSYTTLLDARIRNVNTEKPLLFFTESGAFRTAHLLGEGVWKWRLKSYSRTQSFEDFDRFINKITQYLATDSKKKSLIVNHENFYNSGESIEITAQYFNKNYEFDQNARLSISVRNAQTNQSKTYDLLKSHNYYKVNLDGLQPGKYTFTVKEQASNTTYQASFEVIDFDIEKQYTNADFKKLQLLAQNTGGKTYFPSQIDRLIDELVNSDLYKAVQKEQTQRLPLIDFWTLLCLIIGLLGLEWFIRKYNGLL